MLHQVPQHSAGCLRVGSISSCMLSRGEWWSAKPQEATNQQHTCSNAGPRWESVPSQSRPQMARHSYLQTMHKSVLTSGEQLLISAAFCAVKPSRCAAKASMSCPREGEACSSSLCRFIVTATHASRVLLTAQDRRSCSLDGLRSLHTATFSQVLLSTLVPAC